MKTTHDVQTLSANLPIYILIIIYFLLISEKQNSTEKEAIQNLVLSSISSI